MTEDQKENQASEDFKTWMNVHFPVYVLWFFIIGFLILVAMNLMSDRKQSGKTHPYYTDPYYDAPVGGTRAVTRT